MIASVPEGRASDVTSVLGQNQASSDMTNTNLHQRTR